MRRELREIIKPAVACVPSSRPFWAGENNANLGGA